jgi:acyl carrier protein
LCLLSAVVHNTWDAGTSARTLRVASVGRAAGSGRPAAERGSTNRFRRAGRDEGEETGLASVYERMQVIVAEQLGVEQEQVTREAEFIQDLNADSLDMVELVMSLEEEFGIEISDEEVENIRTVGDAVDFIEENQT